MKRLKVENTPKRIKEGEEASQVERGVVLGEEAVRQGLGGRPVRSEVEMMGRSRTLFPKKRGGWMEGYLEVWKTRTNLPRS